MKMLALASFLSAVSAGPFSIVRSQDGSEISLEKAPGEIVSPAKFTVPTGCNHATARPIKHDDETYSLQLDLGTCSGDETSEVTVEYSTATVQAPPDVKFLSSPKNMRTSCSSNVERELDLPTGVPSNAKALYATVTTYNSNRNDHVNHAFGRNSNHASYTWDNQVHDLNTYLNDVMLTNNGDLNSDGGYHYGHSFGTQIVPLKNGKVQSQLCMGYSHGTHYITLEVYGYIPSTSAATFITTPKNIRTTCNRQLRRQLSLPNGLGVPSNAKAIYATVSTYSDHPNRDTNFAGSYSDHVMFSFGRNSNHASYTWDNQVYEKNTYFNDVMLTNEGQSSGDYHYGASYGSQIIPLNNGKIESNLCLGHSWGTHYVTIEVYGYIPADSKMHFISAPKNIRTSCSSSSKQTLSLPSNSGVPSNANAVYATISTYDNNRDDHVVHSFGRNNNHDGYTWNNRVYDLNTYLNDVMITHEGQSSGKFYYGHSHGSHLIPLTSDNQLEAYVCMGYSQGTHYVTLQVYGYTTA